MTHPFAPKLTLEELEPRIAPASMTGVDADDWVATPAYAGIDVGGWSVPVFADIDGDGDLDLFVGSENGNINFYRNDGTPAEASWTSVTPTYAGIDVGAYSVPVFADIDADGDLDLFVGEQNGNINFYRNDGTAATPSWTSVTSSYASIDVGAWSTPTFADIDADGDLDLFIGEEVDNINFYRNDGTAAAPSWTFMTSSYAGIPVTYSAPTFADTDIDGDLDLFIGEIDGTITVYRNDGTPALASWTFVTGTCASIDVHCSAMPTFADIDADGDLDLFVGEYTGHINFYQRGGDIAVTDSVAPADDLAMDFGDVWNTGPAAPTAAGTVTLTNVTSGYLTVTGLSLADGTQFAIGDFPATPFVLSPGASQDVTVTFQPALLEAYSDTLTILSDDPNEGTVEVALAGRAYFGETWQSGNATVTVVDLWGHVDFAPEDVRVAFGAGDAVSSIVLGGKRSMDGVGVIIHGASQVGNIRDARGGTLGDLAFILSDSPVRNIRLNGVVAGYDANGLGLGGLHLPDDLDGDGDTDDLTALWVDGTTRTVRVGGAVTGDIFVEGPVGNLRTMGPVAGDLTVLGDARNVRIGGHLGYEGGSALILGDVGTLSLASRTSRSDLLSDLDIFGTVRSLTVGARKFGGNVDGDVHIWGDHAGMFQVAGSVEGDVQVDGDLRVGRISGDVWGTVQVFGDVNRVSVSGQLGSKGTTFAVDGELKSLTVGSRRAPADMLSDLDVTGALGRANIHGDVLGQVTVGANLNTLTAGRIFSAVTVAGDLRNLTTASTLVPSVDPVDFVFQNLDPLDDGQLIVGGVIGRAGSV